MPNFRIYCFIVARNNIHIDSAFTRKNVLATMAGNWTTSTHPSIWITHV